MDKAVKLYCDTLGFELKEHSPEWSVIATKLGELTLYNTPKITPLVVRGANYTPISLHVISFEEAASQLEKKGYSVKRKGKHSGTLTDPWGNLLELHDHRKT
jgi:catechol 2,3-dioxygenase-like lactoylglutathione lyase family enzyme